MRIGLLLALAVGGGLGTVARFLLGRAVQQGAGLVFPLGTLAVNVLGCLLLGFLAQRLSGVVLLREEVRLALLVGVMGGFTTFSTYGWETLQLFASGHATAALLNVVLSNALGLLAVWIGWRAALLVSGGP